MLFSSLQPDNPLNQNLKLLPLLQKIIANQSETDPTFLIEINAQVRSTLQNKKPGNINGGKNNSLLGGFDGVYWVAAECTLQSIKELILEGFCLRLGVKIGGTDYKNHFDSASFIYLDVDTGSTIQHSIDLFQGLAFLVYASPSYTPENQKHRIVIRFSEPVLDRFEVETILKLFIQQNDFLDQSCADPARVMYGSLETEFFYSENNVLDLAEYRASEEFQSIYTGLKNPPSRGVDTTGKALPYYYEELASSGDLNAFCQRVGLEYDFEFHSVTPDDDQTILKWEGRNPFSATNSSGTSLVVSLFANDLLVYDRANSQGGTFLRFYYTQTEGYSSFVDQELDKASYQKLLKQFTDHFPSNQKSVPSQSLDDLYFIPDPAKPDKKQLKDIVIILETYIYPEMKSSFHYYNDSDKEESLGVLYYHYDVNHGWKISQSLDLLKTLIVSTFRKVFGSTPISKIVNALTSNVLISLPTYFALDYQPVQDFTYIFFADKMFNLKTKKLEDYDSKVWHFKRLNYAYQEPTNRALLLALEALKRSKVSKKDQRILLNSFILSSQNQYHKTTCMLYLYGESTSGKSTAAKVFGDSQNCSSHTSSTTLNVDHFGSILDTVTILDEVTNVNAIISLLMSLVRDTNDAGNLFRVCNKYVRARMKRLPITLILTGESLTLGTMTTGQIGQTKRLITVEFVQKVEGENNPWMRFNEDSTLAQELFCWAINKDYARLPQRIRWIRSLTISNKEQKARMDDLLQSTDPIYEFIGTTREDTTTDAKGYTPFDIQNCYTAMTNEPFKGSARKRFMDTFSREMKKKYPESFSKSRQRKDENDQSLRYYGFKILPHSND